MQMQEYKWSWIGHNTYRISLTYSNGAYCVYVSDGNRGHASSQNTDYNYALRSYEYLKEKYEAKGNKEYMERRRLAYGTQR